jgi:hypothetical protein
MTALAAKIKAHSLVLALFLNFALWFAEHGQFDVMEQVR